MKTEITESNVRIGEINNEDFALRIDKMSKSINLGYLKDQDNNHGISINGEEIYAGHMLNGIKTGLGYLNNKELNYIGEFKNDKIEGVGILKKQNVLRIGNFKNEYLNGLGCEKYDWYYQGYEEDGYEVKFDRIMIYGNYINGRKNGPFLSVIDWLDSSDRGIKDMLIFEDDKIKEQQELDLNKFSIDRIIKSSMVGKFYTYEYVRILEDTKTGNLHFKYNFNDHFQFIYCPSIDKLMIGNTYNYKDEFETYFEFDNFFNSTSTDLFKIITNNIKYNLVCDNRFNFETIEVASQSILSIYEHGIFSNILKHGEVEKLKLIDHKSFYYYPFNVGQRFELHINNNKYYFAQYNDVNKEVVIVDEILSLNLLNNHEELIPLDDFDDYYFQDFVPVQFETILKYKNKMIDCLEPYYLFIDTETNGLPNKYLLDNDTNKWPRMIQIAYLQFSKEGVLLKRYSSIIKPENFKILDNQISNINHEIAMKEGNNLEFILDILKHRIKESNTIICHNTQFDINVINAEFKRNEIECDIFEKDIFCTMTNSMSFMQSNTYTKLSALYFKLFSRDIRNAHDALADVEATAECFWKMKELSIINVA